MMMKNRKSIQKIQNKSDVKKSVMFKTTYQGFRADVFFPVLNFQRHGCIKVLNLQGEPVIVTVNLFASEFVHMNESVKLRRIVFCIYRKHQWKQFRPYNLIAPV